jgi:DNA-3-methyladenine glycosylase II
VTFGKNNFKEYCNKVCKQHKIIAGIHKLYGYPPHWKRPLNFDTLVKTVLEQQVSLASAQSVYKKLKAEVSLISAEDILTLSANELGTCGITRQKQKYILGIADLLIQQPRFLPCLKNKSNSEVYKQLTSIKGFGPWSANVLMLVMLNRIDVYPEKDVALIKGISLAAFNGVTITNEQARDYINQFAPLRSIAVCYFYWYYINVKGVAFEV